MFLRSAVRAAGEANASLGSLANIQKPIDFSQDLRSDRADRSTAQFGDQPLTARLLSQNLSLLVPSFDMFSVHPAFRQKWSSLTEARPRDDYEKTNRSSCGCCCRRLGGSSKRCVCTRPWPRWIARCCWLARRWARSRLWLLRRALCLWRKPLLRRLLSELARINAVRPALAACVGLRIIDLICLLKQMGARC